jgi:Raf kinase inhibitor-like YbhB/YbcL family protein
MNPPKRWLSGYVALLVSGAATSAFAQAPAEIIVESPAIVTSREMPLRYTPDGHNLSPPITWRNLPGGTRGIVVICEDFGAGNPPPWVHWLVYNIPGTATGLPEGLPLDWDVPLTGDLAGAIQGRNGWNRPYYRGPAPPAGPAHDYNFVVYALDADLDLPPGLNRAAVLEAIEGHVIGRGELIPYYGREPETASAR